MCPTINPISLDSEPANDCCTRTNLHYVDQWINYHTIDPHDLSLLEVEESLPDVYFKEYYVCKFCSLRYDEQNALQLPLK